MPAPSSYTTAQQIFVQDVVRNLYNDDAWLLESRDHSKYAVGKTVNVPNRGTTKTIINQTTASLTATAHGDTLKSYNIEEYQTVPTKINWSEEMLVNYAMREEVLIDHNSQFRSTLAERMLYDWASTHTLLTTGGNKAATVGGSAAGNRKKPVYNDFVRLAAYLTKQNVPNDGRRCLLVSADMHTDMLSIPEFISKDYINNTTPVESGLVGLIAGFKVFVRSRVIVKELATTATEGSHEPKKWLEDNSATERTIAANGTDCAIAWHPNFVSRAVSPDTLVNIIDGHGGVEVSVTAVAGGSKLSNKTEPVGVVTLAETVVSTS